MAKKRKKIDTKQRPLPFGERVDSHLKETEEILSEIRSQKPQKEIENYEDACMALAVACKKAIKESGLTRADVADKINEYFGWLTAVEMEALKEEGKDKGVKHLSVHMFNHYLSKPAEYPMPGYTIYAIQYVTGSLEPCRSFAEAEGGEVVSMAECEILSIGKLFETKIEVSRLLNEFSRGKRRGQ
jgi:hypothetical protein